MRRIGNVLLAFVLTVTLVIPVSLGGLETAIAAKDSIERQTDKTFENNHTSKEWESRGGKTIKVDAWYDITMSDDSGTIKAKLQKKKGDKWETVETKKIKAKGTDNRQTITFNNVDSDGRYKIVFDGPDQNWGNNRLTYEIFQGEPEQNEQPSGEKVASGKNKEFGNNTESKDWTSNGAKIKIELWYDIYEWNDDEEMTLELQKWKNGKFEKVDGKKVKSEGLRKRIEKTFTKEIEKGKIYRIFFNGPNTVMGKNRVTYNVYQTKVETTKPDGQATFTQFDSEDGKLTVKAKATFGERNLDEIKGKWQFKILDAKSEKVIKEVKTIKGYGASHDAFAISANDFKDEKKAIIEATYTAKENDLINGKVTEYKAKVRKESNRPEKEDPPKEDPPKEDPPKEDPPKEDPPKEDPPKEDPPKEDPPKEDPKEVKGKAKFTQFDSKDEKLTVKAKATFDKTDLDKVKGKWQFKILKSEDEEVVYKSKWIKTTGSSHDAIELSTKDFKDEKKAIIEATYQGEKKDKKGKITKYKAKVRKESNRPEKEDPPKEDGNDEEQTEPEQVTIEAKNEITSAGDLSLTAWLKEKKEVKGEWAFTYADQDTVTQAGTQEIAYTIPKDKLQNGKYDLKIAFTSENKKTVGELTLVVEVEGKTDETTPDTTGEEQEDPTTEKPEDEQPGLEEVSDDPDSTVTPPTTTTPTTVTPDSTGKVQLGGPLPNTATKQPIGLLAGASLLLVGCGYFMVRYFRRKSA